MLSPQSRAIYISGRRIDSDSDPFIIAELSGNHGGLLENALNLVCEASKAGAHAVKIQTFTPDSMALDSDMPGFLANPNGPWAGRKLYDLYTEAHTPYSWHKKIFDLAKSLGMIAFSSPFNEMAIDFLESLDCPAYKIASFECIDIPLIQYAAKTGKPLIISTGMATFTEISEAVDAARAAGCRDLVLLKCTSTYPASPVDSNIKTIAHMSSTFDCQAGLSDHTLGIGAAVAAVAFGANIIEKHFTLSRSNGGVDSSFSLEPAELELLVRETTRARQAIGKICYVPTDDEKPARERRRSIYISEDVQEGDIINTLNTKRVRPGLGLPPKFLGLVLGRRFARSAKAGTPLTWAHVGNKPSEDQ